MDNPNPIKYSDLIAPDNSIKDLIAQLEELIEAYEQAKSKIQAAAAQTAKSMQGVSGASEEQRKNIRLTTEESDKLLKDYQDTQATLRQLNEQYQDGNAALREFTKIQKLVDQVNRSAEGSYNRLSAQYRLNKIRLNEMSEAQRSGTEAGRKLEAETKALYEQMNNLQKATGKSQLQVGQYERALGGALGVNSQFLAIITDTNKASETFRGILGALATPVGALIGALGAAVGVFKLFRESVNSTQQTGDALHFEMAAWNARWEIFKKAVATVDFGLFIRGAAEAALAGRNLAQVLDEVFERTSSTRLLRASMSAENAALEEAARNANLSYKERLEAVDNYIANLTPIYEQEVETARRTRDAQLEYLFTLTNKRHFAAKEERKAAEEEFAANIKNYNINEDLIKQARRLVELEDKRDALMKQTATRGGKAAGQLIESYDRQIAKFGEDVREFAEFVRQYNLTRDDEVKEYVKAEEALAQASVAAFQDQKRMVNLRHSLEAQVAKDAQAAAAARQKALEDEAKASAKAAADAESAAKAQAQADAKAAADALAYRRQVLQAQLQSVQLEIAVTREGTQEMLDLRIAAINKQRDIELFENEQKEEALRQSEAAINAKYDAQVLKTSADFAHRQALQDLDIYQDLQASEFALEERNARQVTQFRLQQERERLAKILELDTAAVEKMTEEEAQAIRNTIARIDKDISSTQYGNLFDVFGIKASGQQQGALMTAVDSVKDSIGGIVDSWAKAAAAAVKAADTQVDAAQRVLDAQIEARNEGYANEVQAAQRELALAQRNREKALKEQERANRAQMALDTLTQTSSLITASANLWASLSKAGVAGPALAIAAIAAMWGSFAAAKIKAAQVTKEEYGEGTVELLQGGSHASGHDIDLGTKADGTRRRAEGGEFFAVINKRNSRRFKKVIPDVINAFNNGTFADKYEKAGEAMAAYAVTLGGADVTGIEKDVRAIRRQGDEVRYADGTGHVVIRYRNLTRRVKS